MSSSGLIACLIFLYPLTLLSCSCIIAAKKESHRGEEGYKAGVVSWNGKNETPDGPPGTKGKEGYDPAKVSLFGANNEPVAAPGGKSNKGGEGYKPEVVSLFGKSENVPAGPPGTRGKEGYNPAHVKW
jgi:hypothetical protein